IEGRGGPHSPRIVIPVQAGIQSREGHRFVALDPRLRGDDEQGAGEGGMTEPLARTTDLVKCFGDNRALDGVAMAIAPGRITGLVGPDGAGKTTLIRILAGLMAPSSGTVEM